MLCKILSPIELLFPSHIYTKTNYKDIFKYGSIVRKTFIKTNNLNGYVENHHIIPIQHKNHKVLKVLEFNINCNYNICILPNRKYYKVFEHETARLLIHQYGHKKYNNYVKDSLNIMYSHFPVNEDIELLKYKFWLFYSHLKKHLLITDDISTIPWK
jgi:hypothetical protein